MSEQESGPNLDAHQDQRNVPPTEKAAAKPPFGPELTAWFKELAPMKPSETSAIVEGIQSGGEPPAGLDYISLRTFLTDIMPTALTVPQHYELLVALAKGSAQKQEAENALSNCRVRIGRAMLKNLQEHGVPPLPDISSAFKKR